LHAETQMIAVTDYIATLPKLICRRLEHDPRLKVLTAPAALGTFPVEMAWHIRYRHDPAHRWLREIVGQVVQEVSTGRQIEFRPYLRGSNLRRPGSSATIAAPKQICPLGFARQM
jgi:hypothetical protein